MNEISNEIIEAAIRLQLPKFAKGGFIPLEGHPVGQNRDEKDVIGPQELFVRIRDDEKCSMEKLSDALISESIPTDWTRTLRMRRSC